MDPSSQERNPVDEVAEEFVERYRRGERPSLQEYTDRYPEWSDKIRALFPALVAMEKARPEPGEASAPERSPSQAAPPLERLGEYRILREVGRGGMGVVYEAEQESLGRHVALKVLGAGAMIDPRHLLRFRREARAAARLHHTNIVPVHGVGEQDGLHYYVMQFIQGQGLDEVLAELRHLRRAKRALAPGPATTEQLAPRGAAADVAQSLFSGRFTLAEHECGPEVSESLTASQRKERESNPSTLASPIQADGSTLSESGWRYWRSVARIGLQVADALAYASSQGVLHRDIKPSNLLLDTRGTVWVTDFGLAKAETDQDNVTQTGDIVGTLRYLAPERLRGQADVRGDLYALGLTLYELLTLRAAFPETDRNRLMSAIMNESPAPPRKVDPAVPHDLETVVLKAIAREPAQRYQTPGELSDDLQRFVDDRPILARRQGPAQRCWRWCRRNPAQAFLGTGLGAVLLLGTTISTWQAVRATRERDRAEENFKLAREAVDRYFTKVSQSPSLRAVGLENLRKDLLLQAKEFYERFIREQPEGIVLQGDLGKAYGRLGAICTTLGETTEAEGHYDKSIAIFDELSRREPDEASHLYHLAQARRDLGELFRETSRPEMAQPQLEQAVANAKTLVDRHPNERAYQHELALTQRALGEFYRLTDRFKNAEDAYRQAMTLEEKLIGEDSDASGQYRSVLATSAGRLAEVYRIAGPKESYKKAEELIQRGVGIFEELVHDFPQEEGYHHDLALQFRLMGSLYLDKGYLDKAAEPLQRSAGLAEKLVRKHPDVLDYAVLMANSYNLLMRLENNKGNPSASLVWCDKADQALQPVFNKEPRHKMARLVLTDLRMGRIIASAQIGDYDQGAKTAGELARQPDLTPVDHYNLACAYSRFSEAAEKDAKRAPSSRAQLREQYANRAMDALRQAVAMGFKSILALHTDPDLNSLRQRSEFKMLLQELEGTAPAPAAAK